MPDNRTETPAGEPTGRQVQSSSAGPASARPAAAPPLFAVPELHEVQFATNTRTGDFRALCSCGWCRVGPGRDEQAIRGQAATHDIDWVDALNAERVAP